MPPSDPIEPQAAEGAASAPSPAASGAAPGGTVTTGGPGAPSSEPTVAMIDRAGRTVQVPHDQASQAFLSGQLGFAPGQPIPVVQADGTVGTIAPEHAQGFLASGGQLATSDEYRRAQLDARYGGLLGGAAAAGEGAARGISLGLSDPLAVGVGRLFGGDTAAEAVREHLAGEREEHPIASGVGELAGAAAPAIASGGASEAASAAGEAEAIGAIARGVRTLGALPRGIQYLGDAAEHAIGGVLGATAKTTLGRAAQGAVKMATDTLVQGGLYGAGSAISDATLSGDGDLADASTHESVRHGFERIADLVSEKLFSDVGHGALMGGLLGAGLGAAGSASVDLLRNMLGSGEEPLASAAGEQTWKWLDPLKKYSEEAGKRAGGTDAVGRTVFEQVLRPLAQRDGLGAVAVDNEQKLSLIQDALEKKGKEIGDLVAGNAHAEVPLSDLLAPIDDRIEQYEGTVGGEDKVATLQRLRASVTRVLGAQPPPGETIDAKIAGLAPGSPEHEAALADAGYVRRTPEETADYLREHPDALERMGNGPAPIDVTHRPPPAAPEQPVMVPIAKAIEQRRALQQIAFEESRSLDPKLRVQLLRDVTHDWNDVEQRTLDAASKDATPLQGTQLRALNRDYQHLKIAEDAVETNTSRYASNRNLSLTDYLMGAAHAPSLLATGHPLGAAASLATSLAHRAVRAHGNAYAALVLDRLSTMAGTTRAVLDHDQAIDGSVAKIVGGREPGAPGVRALAREGHAADNAGRFEREEERVRQIAAMSTAIVGAHLAAKTAPLAAHLPDVAAQLQDRTRQANGFLASKLPPSADLSRPSLTPQLETTTVSAADRARFLRYVDAVEGGAPAILKRVAAGRVTTEDVEVLRALFPKSYAEIQTKLVAACASAKRPLPYQTRLRIAQTFGVTSDPTLAAPFVAGVQKSYAAHPQGGAGGGGAAAPRKSAPASLSVSDALRTPFERAAGGDG